MKRSAVVLAFLLLLTGSACSGMDESSNAQAVARKPSCPAAWRAGWQRLANQIDAPVYCPSWIPDPLDGDLNGRWASVSVHKKSRSYLAGFIWFEKGSEIHVNLRGYAGRTRIPLCRNDEQAGRKRVKTFIPCFSDSKGTKRVGGIGVTLYTVNRDADQWHLLYAWRHKGSLYTLSEHVAPPFGYRRVIQNLDRMMRNLVLVNPV